MESGLPLLNCLLQQTLRTICTSPNSSTSSKWVYAVFWRILPRNFPPPRWEFGGTALDLSKGNKRNWILVWEDGFCDFNECEQRKSGSGGYLNGRFGADVFFKMSHEVYNYGEGLVGKVAADNSHKWVYNESHNNECEASYIATWNTSVEPQPKAWESQFNSGIQSIVIIAVREGVVQLGSFNKIAEDLNLVISIQRQFSYLQSIPGVFGIQRSYLPIQHPYIVKPSFIESNGMPPYEMTWNNNPQIGAPGPSLCSGSPPLPLPLPLPLPTMPCSFGALLSKLPSGIPLHNQVPDSGTQSSTIERVKIEDCEFYPTHDGDHKGKVPSLNK
ncbi:protein RICE SALT SENSITIVE 3-like [Vigna unguiculata]|uniref:Transcription factor MYC/MYB N-terminal n=1 Tax=Vigna unguiculata TaxID=3917 RepID=A0A4D6NW01_VIGUN|nr:protein RICE SALT SENSITIVE 3-like [Vigna unguiculata]QCE16505.1 Transcription factor MYC/MYB N-terminal [Vigna unguiculata]